MAPYGDRVSCVTAEALGILASVRPTDGGGNDRGLCVSGSTGAIHCAHAAKDVYVVGRELDGALKRTIQMPLRHTATAGTPIDAHSHASPTTDTPYTEFPSKDGVCAVHTTANSGLRVKALHGAHRAARFWRGACLQQTCARLAPSRPPQQLSSVGGSTLCFALLVAGCKCCPLHLPQGRSCADTQCHTVKY